MLFGSSKELSNYLAGVDEDDDEDEDDEDVKHLLKDGDLKDGDLLKGGDSTTPSTVFYDEL